MKNLPCLGYKIFTTYGYEYDCGYNTDVSCDDCVHTGGFCDPRYDMGSQPYKLSKFVLKIREDIEKKLNRIYHER